MSGGGQPGVVLAGDDLAHAGVDQSEQPHRECRLPDLVAAPRHDVNNTASARKVRHFADVGNTLLTHEPRLRFAEHFVGETLTNVKFNSRTGLMLREPRVAVVSGLHAPGGRS